MHAQRSTVVATAAFALRDTALPITMAGLHIGFEFSRSSQLCNTEKAAEQVPHNKGFIPD